MAAIVAVVEEMWPHQTMEDDMANRAETAWKFANRWWQGSSVGSRLRPRRPGAFS
jgi:hypothetical protein